MLRRRSDAVLELPVCAVQKSAVVNLLRLTFLARGGCD